MKTSSLAIERERKVTSTVRKENSALRMRLEAAYESTKSGMQLRTLERICDLAPLLHACPTLVALMPESRPLPGVEPDTTSY